MTEENYFTTGIVFGAWDLLHPGHIKLLQYCKSKCDWLIVGLHDDPSIERKSKLKPIQTLFDRYVQLNGCKWVDEIIPYNYEADVKNMLAVLPVNIRFLGSDYQHSLNKITGEGICNLRDIELCFVPRLHNYSSTNLREKIYISKLYDKKIWSDN